MIYTPKTLNAMIIKEIDSVIALNNTVAYEQKNPIT
jgi:hypothetical protein